MVALQPRFRERVVLPGAASPGSCSIAISKPPLERIRPDWFRRGRGGLRAAQGAPTSRNGVRRGGATQYRGQYGRHRQAGLAEHALETQGQASANLPVVFGSIQACLDAYVD